ncbi:uncharacterized protein K02A2.6-like [Rhagoletis pomonella]|uniref:uncharacterized protein K02A2.6-like n=1 Tax=Rhagoletis pomonella TaxID=28610 RepID=UPI001783AAE9|nr:uncharacterized protein K02A2.6-like [Rhagoletis pomonella]
MIRDNIVIGINSQKLQKKLLETENLTLQKTIDIARAAELVEKYADEMQQQNKYTEVNSISTHKQISQNSGKRNSIVNAKSLSTENAHIKHKMRQSSNCKFCRGVHEFRKCPAFGKKCNNCGRLNHFSVACYSSQVHEIRENDEKRENDDIVLHNIEDLAAGRKRWYEKIRVNDCLINFKLDTGADVNILPYKYFKKYLKNTALDTGGLSPRSYSGADLDYKGIIECVVMCRNEIKILPFTVVDTPYEPLLGLEACEQLNLIKRIDVIREASKDEFIRNYSDVFEGTGCFVTNLDIKVKKSSVPVVKPARRIPQSLVAKVKNELQNMVEKKIIERVDGPIERASNLVIVEKKSGKLRLCIDPQDLNADILSENHTIPSFESISVRIANSKIFTVLDLKEGFWQIGLSAKASELCSFNTPFGCYRFKRLPFGIKIGPGVFQKYNERNYEDIPNVIVFIDDILIAAKSVEEHDRTLRLVMERARKLNIKFNVDKIQYKVTEVKYLGKIISLDGIRCDPDRVRAIMQIQKPNNKKDLQKLLGMISYIREYIPNLSSISQPLRELLKSNVVYEWQSAHESCLQLIKAMIANAPTLQSFDDKKEITVETDASKFGIGKFLYIADLLSRYFDKENNAPDIEDLNEFVHSLNITDERLTSFRKEIENDNLLAQLKTVLKNGIDKTKKRARELVYWPGIDDAIEKMITKCNVCQRSRSVNVKEPMIPHTVPNLPFNKLGIDICEFASRNYLIIADYYSRYLEIALLKSKTSSECINALKTCFSVHGIPVEIVSDNMPFNSYEFKRFCDHIGVKLTTISPGYSQSNGFAERFVGIAKNLIKKANESNQKLRLALLEYRNTPLKDVDASPVELLMKLLAKELSMNTPSNLALPARKALARKHTLEMRQKKWDESSNGRWTQRLIPNIEKWFSRPYGEANFHLTQMLTGHGCFRSFLKRFKHEELDHCEACGDGIIEDVEHVLFHCPRFDLDKNHIRSVFGEHLTPENMVVHMIESVGKWEAVNNAVTHILTQLRRDEPRRNGRHITTPR